eukprot:SAG31_NODE_1343_length_8700_cov_1.967911_8_plen_142_part_00
MCCLFLILATMAVGCTVKPQVDVLQNFQLGLWICWTTCRRCYGQLILDWQSHSPDVRTLATLAEFLTPLPISCGLTPVTLTVAVCISWGIQPIRVYPPCNTMEFQALPIDGPAGGRKPIILSIAQFRPEKVFVPLFFPLLR